MSALQLELFSENTEVCFLRRDVEDLKKKNDNLRKGMFFRHNEIEKTVFELKEEIERLKKTLLEVNK